MAEIAVREYLTWNGRSPYQNWFNALPESSAARVAIAILRLEEGNVSNVKGVGEGVFEYRINWGPGYRVYFGKDGDTVVILLGDSSKQRQAEAIARAREHWEDYKARKKRSKKLRKTWP